MNTRTKKASATEYKVIPTHPYDTCLVVTIECVFPQCEAHDAHSAQQAIETALEDLQALGSASVMKKELVEGDFDHNCRILLARSRMRGKS